MISTFGFRYKAKTRGYARVAFRNTADARSARRRSCCVSRRHPRARGADYFSPQAALSVVPESTPFVLLILSW